MFIKEVLRLKRIMVSLPDDISDKLQKQADIEKRSLSNLIRIAVEKYLEEVAK
jgi:metal-responsive CopG/Arc/MetJ family transcriptional regulator